MILFGHARHELLCQPVVCQCIHIKSKADVFLARVEDALATRNAGIIDEDRGLTDIPPDFYCNGRDGGWGRDVTPIIVDILRYFWSVG